MIPSHNINKYSMNDKYRLVKTESSNQDGRSVKILTYKRIYDWKWKIFSILATFFTAGLALKNNKIFWACREVVYGETKKKQFIQHIGGAALSRDGKSSIDSKLLPTPVLSSKAIQPSTQTTHFFTAYINPEEHAASLILDEDMEWNHTRAPYLFDDIKMADGFPVPMQAGDYLLKLKLVNSHPELKGNDILEEKTGIYFPGSMIREMKPGQILTLKYKGEPIHITLMESGAPLHYYAGQEVPCPSFQTLIQTTEHLLYVKYHGFSSKPVPITLESAEDEFSKGKRYDHPALIQRKKQKLATAEIVKSQFLNTCKIKEGLMHYRFSSEKNQFEPVDTLDLTAALKEPAIAAWQIANNHLCIELPGETDGIVLTLSENHLLILQDKKLVIPEGATLILNTIPEQVISVVNLKENHLTKQGILDHLYKAKFIHGLLLLMLKPIME